MNGLPAKAQIEAVIEPQVPRGTLSAFLDRLDAYQLNVNFPSFLKLLQAGYVQQEGDKITVTPKGDAVLHCVDKAGLTGWRLYLILRLLENVQTDEAAYEEVLNRIQETVQDRPALHQTAAMAAGPMTGN